MADLFRNEYLVPIQSYLPFDGRSYVGQVVFVERVKTDKEHGNYYGGEYVIIRQSPANLYGIKTNAVTDTYFSSWSAGGDQLEMLGEFRYGIVKAWRDDKFVRSMADRALKLSKTPKDQNGKRHYIDSVYDAAAMVARNLYESIGAKMPEENVESAKPENRYSLAAVLAPHVGSLVSSQTVADELLKRYNITLKPKPPKEQALDNIRATMQLQKRKDDVLIQRSVLQKLFGDYSL